jgi:hypothetical protein
MNIKTGTEVHRESHGKTGTSNLVLEKMMNEVDEFPDRLSIERSSPHYCSSAEYIGIAIDGVVSTDVIAFHRSARTVWLAERTATGALISLGNGGYKKTIKEDVDIQISWRLQPSRQVRRAMKRKHG